MKTTKNIIIALVVLLSFTSVPSYTFKEEDAIKIYNHLEMEKQILPTTDMPSKDMVRWVKDADSLQQIIKIQFEKNHPDTTNKKK